MIEGSAEPKLELFPVQVIALEPIRIDFEAAVPPSGAVPPKYHDPKGVAFGMHVKYNVETDQGIVIVEAWSEFGSPSPADSPATDTVDEDEQQSEEAKAPYRLSVQVGMQFTYSQNEMSKEDVELWCKEGAFFIASPYLRQLMTDVIARTSFPNVVPPLVEVPIFREGKAKEDWKPATNGESAAPPSDN